MQTNKDVQPILQLIASLDVPFIEECQRMMEFGRDVVEKLLCTHMFKRMRTKERTKKAKNVVETLSSVKLFKVHGRLIDGNTARKQLGLNVRLLAKDDQFWVKIWEYYNRAEIAMSNIPSPKMFETRHEILAAKTR